MADLDQLLFQGNLFIEEAIFLHKKSRTLMVADFIQNHAPVTGKPIRNALLKFAGAAYPDGGVPLGIRLSFTNRVLARESLAKLFSWDFDKLILAHGVCVERNAKAFVKRAFKWLAN